MRKSLRRGILRQHWITGIQRQIAITPPFVPVPGANCHAMGVPGKTLGRISASRLLLDAAKGDFVVELSARGLRQEEQALGEILVESHGYAPRTAENNMIAWLIHMIKGKNR
jgi:hypothetical protein